MNFISKTSLLLLAPFALLSCNQEAKTAGNTSEPTSSEGVKAYPLEVCTVSGKKLGSMGDPHVIVHEGQEIKFCCAACEPAFKKDPAKFLAKLSAE